MELENLVSNVAYCAHKELIQRQNCNQEMVTTEECNDRTINNESLNKLKSKSLNTELIKIKKIQIAMVLLVAVLVVTTLMATIFSILSYRMSRLHDKSAITLPNTIVQSYCGAGQWHRIAFLNMSDPSQQCKSAWREYNTSGVRACGRAYSTEGSCSNKTYGTESMVYSKVCGQVIGYQVASPDAFNTVDMDGVKLTQLGVQNHHIWSFVGGVTENSPRDNAGNCPCSFNGGPRSPSYINCHYYCESGNPTDGYENNQIFSNDPLWDGQQCEGTCCTSINSPPWFSVQLPAPTTGAIEVSICADESTDNEDTPIKLLEIYIQ